MAKNNPNDTLLMYVNDALALERDIKEVVTRQMEDENVRAIPQAAMFLQELSASTQTRHAALGALSETLGSGAGVVKETVATAAGLLAGLYGKVRKHPVSRDLRDDYTALALASTAYSMLYTTGVALRSEATASLAEHHLKQVTPIIMALSQIIPTVVLAELASDFPDVNLNAGEDGRKLTAEAWSQHGN